MFPSELAGKYDVCGTLGAGAMGTVFDAFDRLIERRVAIKVVRLPPAGDPEADEARARFRREGQAAGRLAHPNIVAVYDYGENADTAWIVMELVEGGSLKAPLDRDERLPVSEIVRVMEQMLAALAFSHGKGVVHRDIKPANVMLARDGTVKLADFGIARLENSSMTQVGTVMGTVPYMSPEQLRGEPADLRTDIWASGVMLYQLLTGEKPFGGNFNSVMHKALNTEPTPPSVLAVTAPRGFDAVVARALAKRPEDRFANATEMAHALREALTARPGQPAGFADAGPLPGLDDATILSTGHGGTIQGGTARPGAGAGSRPPGTVTKAAAGTARENTTTSRVPLLAGVALAVALAGGGAAWWFTRDPGTAPATEPRIAENRVTPGAGPGTGTPPRPADPVDPVQRAPVLPAPTPSQTPSQSPSARAPQPDAPTTDPSSARAPEATGPVSPSTPPAVATPPAGTPPARPADPSPATAGPSSAGPSPTGQPRPEEPRVALLPNAPPAATPAPPVTPSVVTPPPAATPPGPAPAVTPIPPPFNPPVTPAIVAPPPPDFAAAAATASRAAPCSLLAASGDRTGVTVAGVLRRGGEPAVQGALAQAGVPPGSARLSMQPFDGPYCSLVDALRPVLAAPGAAPQIALVGSAPLRDGELIRFDLTMPNTPSFLHLAYATKEAEVVMLVGGTQQPAGARPRIGDPRPGWSGWEVGEPYGTDLAIALVSDRPLFPEPRPAEGEPIAAFLAALDSNIRRVRAAGGTVSARAVVVETAARK